jgi:hypothetical protein
MTGQPVRRAFILTAAAALAWSLGGCQGKSPGEFLGDAFGGVMSPDPSEIAPEAFNVYDPDRRRNSVALLSNASWGGEKPYLKTYRLLVDDPDPTVRAASIAALGTHGTTSDVPAITRYLRSDRNKIVRWEAAKALQKIHDDQAIAALLSAGREDEDKDVRMAAINALGQYPQRRVFDGLVGALDDPDFGVAREAEQALRTLTGKDFGDRPGPWWQWAEASEQIFADQQPYYYPQYSRPPGLVDWMKFWSEPDAIEPRTPRATGDEPADADGPEIIYEGNLGASG